MAFKHDFDPTVLREYDIRGIVGRTLNPPDAFAIGRAFGTIVSRAGGHTVAVGYDGRLSSPDLERPLVDGLKTSGMEVIRIGLGPTPMLYFAATTLHTDGAVMLTGSHNPADYNGFKMMLGKKPFFGEQIKALGAQVARGDVVAEAQGSERQVDVSGDYVARLISDWDGGDRLLNVVWDNGNGAAGEVLTRLVASLPGNHTVLFADIDGRFPNHHPDPTVPANLQALVAEVRRRGADVGIAFDGDADRIGVVDDTGEVMFGDQLMVVLARDVLKTHPGATVIADVKASQVLFDEIAAAGGKPLMWKTGHSLIKAKMAETGAPLAGEMSGHTFYADKWYGFDDALYAGGTSSGYSGPLGKTALGDARRLAAGVEHTGTAVRRGRGPEIQGDRGSRRTAAPAGGARVGHRRRASAHRRWLVAVACVQHPGGAGGPRRGEQRARAGAAEAGSGGSARRLGHRGAGFFGGA